MKKATVITICFIFFLCSTFTFCYATSSQGNPQKGILIADKGERHEKIEKLEEKIKQLKEDKEKIEKEIQENEKELRHLKKKKS